MIIALAENSMSNEKNKSIRLDLVMDELNKVIVSGIDGSINRLTKKTPTKLGNAKSTTVL